jgi:hypothetical protein
MTKLIGRVIVNSATCWFLLGCATPAARSPAPAPSDATLAPPTAAEAELAVQLLLAATDPRVTTRRARAPQILVPELAGLKRLLDKVDLADPVRPKLLRRLAEEHVELRAAAVREVAKAAGTAAAADWAHTEQDASQRAQEYFRQLMAEYPTYEKMSDLLFFLGVEQGLHGNRDGLRASLSESIAKDGQTRLTPLAHFIQGELFRLEGKAEDANQAYRVVVAAAAPQGGVSCLALERLNRSSAFRRLKYVDPDAFSESSACERNQQSEPQ